MLGARTTGAGTSKLVFKEPAVTRRQPRPSRIDEQAKLLSDEERIDITILAHTSSTMNDATFNFLLA